MRPMSWKTAWPMDFLTRLHREDDDLALALRRTTAPLLSFVLRASAAVLAVTGIAAVLMKSMPLWWVYGSFATVIATALLLDEIGRSRAAAVVLPLGFWAVASVTVAFLGGVRSPGTFVYLPVVVTAGLFWSWRAAAGLTLASIVVEVSAAILEGMHLLPTPLQAPTPGPLLRIFAASLVMTGVLVGVAVRSLRAAIADANRYAKRSERVLLDAPDVIAVLNRSGIVTGVSHDAIEQAGYRVTDVVGRHFSRSPLFACAMTDDLRALATAGRPAGFELELVRKDGSPFWAEAHLHEFRREDGSTSVRIALRDVTRRKLAEKRERNLDAQVARLRRFEEIGLIAGGVSHDVNNLLTVILASSSVLERQVPEGSLARELITEISTSAARAATLERRVLSVGQRRTADVVDVSQVVDELRHILSRLVGSAVTLSIRSNGRPCFVRADPAHLERIVLNLAANARDAMPSGGELVVQTAHAPRDGQSSTEDLVELCATDTGVGMDGATIQRIFDPFYTTKGTGGTGLGLAAVREIVNDLGGHIRVESEPGRGTRIRVLLPTADPSEA
jgi:PAS domain S-box-containing protein